MMKSRLDELQDESIQIEQSVVSNVRPAKPSHTIKENEAVVDILVEHLAKHDTEYFTMTGFQFVAY